MLGIVGWSSCSYDEACVGSVEYSLDHFGRGDIKLFLQHDNSRDKGWQGCVERVDTVD